MACVWNRPYVALCGMLLCVCCAEALGYPVGSNSWHLDSPLQATHNADVVCKVYVGAVRDVGQGDSRSYPLAPPVRRIVAEARVVSLVKGSCPAEIEIEHEVPVRDDASEWGSPICQLFTELRPGESCLVFLQGSENPYLLGPIQSKARVVAAPVPYDLGDDPVLRLMEEFLAGAACDDEFVRLQATEELGYLGSELMKEAQTLESGQERFRQIANALREARLTIRTLRESTDFVLHAAATVSSFQLGDPPTCDETLRILLADPVSFSANASQAKYGIRDFCVTSMQKRLLEMMDSTTRRIIKDLDSGAVIRAPGERRDIHRGIPGFPYARFFRAALATETVTASEEMRRAIANVIWIRYENASIPEMVFLLDDSLLSIRRTAVSALNKCINRNFSNEWDQRTFYQMDQTSGQSDRKPLDERLRDYERNEQEYIRYWKNWWEAHRDEFVNAGSGATPQERLEY